METFQLSSLHKNGDIMIGGIFEVSYRTVIQELSFTSKPGQWVCEGFDIALFQTAQALVFAVEEINNDTQLLPNVKLGYTLYDNCMRLPVALRGASALTLGMKEDITENCKGPPPVLAIVGDPTSTHSIAISRILSLFQIPMVSYFATCPCLSDKWEYPTFFRTIPSDTFQIKVISAIFKHYGWTWVGIIAADDDYGQSAIKALSEEIKDFACIAFSITIPKINDIDKVRHVTKMIKESSAKVIVVFSPAPDFSTLADEINQQNIIGRQWIASESWSNSYDLFEKYNFSTFGGTLGITIHNGEMPGFQTFLHEVQPTSDPKNNLILQFWETMFDCKFKENTNEQNSTSLLEGKQCTGKEDIKGTKTAYTDVSKLRACYNIYKAVYAIAHALHNLLTCENGNGPFVNKSCADITNMQPWQLLHYLKKVNFTTHIGERVAFDENGDALAIYDIVNWQQSDHGTLKTVTVGFYAESAPAGHELSLKDDDIIWNINTGKIPESVCSKSCQPGTRKATREREPVCCFDCIQCAAGEISTQVDAVECIKCPIEFWSNVGRNECVPKEIEFLSFEDSMGITLTATAASGVCLSVIVLSVFIHYRHTPVVKANNSELSFLLLVSLTLCFLCSLCFIGHPTELTCKLRHILFGISFVLCISCILVKTIVVIMAFKATLPGNNIMKWFGVIQQRSTVFFFTFIQALICIIWLTASPPLPAKNIQYQNSKIIFECDIGSVTGFSCLLGYIGLLTCISFLLAFLARNLPDTFNEAKFITFSMLIFCAVWITFIPAYISSPGKYTVAVEIFAILASSFGLLFAIFAPKCFIILIRPELNTKKALMGRDSEKQI
ncbi:extracellular calcium-sensing receptor-like [Polypterus senegalus]|uniref:extracellular calcium-sensing receptor-like n=1 Tax=Polypterus senegalus TaxID=55291 RepID=UPI0019657503|nr:extracellular calcium-sensing receptor-like [Polypterus senegalus]